jgi:hypothetical protein
MVLKCQSCILVMQGIRYHVPAVAVSMVPMDGKYAGYVRNVASAVLAHLQSRISLQALKW